jgi:hypothetical protein
MVELGIARLVEVWSERGYGWLWAIGVYGYVTDKSDMISHDSTWYVLFHVRISELSLTVGPCQRLGSISFSRPSAMTSTSRMRNSALTCCSPGAHWIHWPLVLLVGSTHLVAINWRLGDSCFSRWFQGPVGVTWCTNQRRPPAQTTSWNECLGT